MQVKQTGENYLRPVDQRHFNEKGQWAENIVNMRWDSYSSCWVNDRGFEPLTPVRHDYISFDEIQASDRLFIWERQQGAELYIITKRADGQLFYPIINHNNVGSGESAVIKIADRSPSKQNEPDEQFISWDRFLFIINGNDDMLKFMGRGRVQSFGFTKPTPQPGILGVDPAYYYETNADGLYKYNQPNTTSVRLCKFYDGAGLGFSSTPDRKTPENRYRYRITFITDTGSESPISTFEEVTWVTPDQFADEDGSGPGAPHRKPGLTACTANFGYAVTLDNLPIGPPGTVARRIYRTRNIGSFTGFDTNYYLVGTIEDNVSKNFTDVTPDDLLIIPAPNEADSVVIPSGWRLGTAWSNRMWLANTADRSTRIIYSEQGLPEQFRATAYFDVGTRDGGQITALFPYYDNLLVFRERTIDVIRETPQGLVISNLVRTLGTTATDTICEVPGVGIVFLSYDGVYALSGGLVGGSTTRVKKISEGISDEIRRMNVSAINRARAAYSHREKEYWCHIPSDGSVRPNRGIVYHSDVQGWSFRRNPTELPEVDKFTNEGSTVDAGPFAINDIAVLPSGHFVFVHNPVIERDVQGQFVSGYEIFPYQHHVWSGIKSQGRRTISSLVSVIENNQTVLKQEIDSSIKTDEPWAYYESENIDFDGQPNKKRFISVDIQCITSGHNTPIFEYAVDGLDDFTDAGVTSLSQRETMHTQYDMALLGPVNPQLDLTPAIVDESKWAQYRPVRIRWDIHTSAVHSMKWRIRSKETIQIVSVKVSVNESTRTTQNQKSRR